jgi:DNA-directed RNA polymerase specialized sigma24 family protein
MLPRLPTVADHRSLFLGRYERLVARARSLLGTRLDLAHDLVHEAFVQFITRKPSLDAITDLDAYLHGMVRYLHLSRLRRAGRFPMLPIADFDSVLASLHGTDGTARIHALHELAHLCRYAGVRKESSPAASVLILRFFWGYSPAAVAALAHASSMVVAQRLRRARVEARTYLDTPGRVAFLRRGRESGRGEQPPPLVHFDPAASIHETCAQALGAIIRTRQGECLTSEGVVALYANGRSVPVPTLAHLSSCPACLDRAERHLGVDRRDGFASGSGGWSGPNAGAAFEEEAEESRAARRIAVDRVDAPADADAARRARPGRGTPFDARRANRLLWRFTIAILIGWLVFGGGASTLAAAAGRVWRWVSHAAADVIGSRAPAPPPSADAARLVLGARPVDIGPMQLPQQAVASMPVTALVSSALTASAVSSAAGAAIDTTLIDLQVQAFQRLDGIDALLGEQVVSTRTRDRLRLSIIVDEPSRARQVHAALSPLASDRRVVMRVDAAQDVAARAARAAIRPGGAGSAGSAGGAVGSGATVRSGRGAVRQYTVDADRTAMGDDHALARRVVDASHRALRHTWALRRVVDAFTVPEVETMHAATSAAWHELIATHVRGYQRELDELTRVLTTVVTPPPPSSDGPRVELRQPGSDNAADLDASLRMLLARASEVDDAVQRSFRSSGLDVDEAQASVKTAAFWRALADAQRLASAIAPAAADREP